MKIAKIGFASLAFTLFFNAQAYAQDVFFVQLYCRIYGMDVPLVECLSELELTTDGRTRIYQDYDIATRRYNEFSVPRSFGIYARNISRDAILGIEIREGSSYGQVVYQTEKSYYQAISVGN